MAGILRPGQVASAAPSANVGDKRDSNNGRIKDKEGAKRLLVSSVVANASKPKMFDGAVKSVAMLSSDMRSSFTHVKGGLTSLSKSVKADIVGLQTALATLICSAGPKDVETTVKGVFTGLVAYCPSDFVVSP
ncbi:MAG: hypothetical protein O3A01_05615 [bacterium]|nr:hypothetical protein [bacterium]